MRKKTITIGLIFLMVIGSYSCKEDVTPPAECTEEISYTQDIEPVVMLSCAITSCHNSNSTAAGYDFTTHSLVSANAGIMLSAIKHDGGFSPMPLGGDQWPDSSINKFSCWIQQGKLNN